MIEVVIRGEETQLDPVEVERAFRGVRVFTQRDGNITCITDADAEHPELKAIGGHPQMAYSFHSAYHPSHPKSEGFKCEQEWRGFPLQLTEIARVVAEDQYAERVKKGTCIGRLGSGELRKAA